MTHLSPITDTPLVKFGSYSADLIRLLSVLVRQFSGIFHTVRNTLVGYDTPVSDQIPEQLFSFVLTQRCQMSPKCRDNYLIHQPQRKTLEK